MKPVKNFSLRNPEIRDFFTLLKGSGTVLFTKVAGIGVVFVYHLLLTRYLGSNDYGIYVYVFVLTGTLSIFGQLGINRGSLKFMSAFAAGLEFSKLKGVIFRSHQIVSGACIILSIATLVIVWLLRHQLDEKLVFAFFIGIWHVLLYALMILRQQVARSFKNMFNAYFPDQILLPALCAVAVFSLYQLDLLNFWTALLSHSICSVLILMIGWRMIKRGVPPEVFRASPEYITSDLIKVSLPLFFASFMLIIFNRIDLLMLGPLSSLRDAGIYNAAVKIAKLSSLPLFAINAIATPMIAGLFHRGNRERLGSLLHVATRLVVLTTLPIVIVSIVLSEELLGIFGNDFKTGSLGLIFLVGANFANASCGTVGSLLTMCGQQTVHAKIFMWTAISNVVLNLILIPALGITGAAIATFMSTVMLNVWMIYTAKNRLDMKAYYLVSLTSFMMIAILAFGYYFLYTRSNPYISSAIFVVLYALWIVRKFGVDHTIQNFRLFFQKRDDLR